mmetsp:Transcript_30700/g.45442  ORF Transcript_30700/g.45442 Transcript_30700/m.45442 type:complete len:257 (-) Transcript_30700:460-1230(-)|eukprot:CAMPEP_0195527418 /NCGR_PEP_ID=MMETSP0794_2-20130614/29081_1 /TAXON_ID=515487 /ORGANISM="Stephanopyxis turris, Strain CCMP 815" /LENGTH=256 /DNA_ID=CAMNT_0040658317 /DNA_START=75 /DNA_END=845 /DNA_ORIENTATION=+
MFSRKTDAIDDFSSAQIKQTFSDTHVATKQHAQISRGLKIQLNQCRKSSRHVTKEKDGQVKDFLDIVEENRNLQSLLLDTTQRNNQLQSQVKNLVQEKDLLEERLEIHKTHWHNTVNIEKVVTNAVRNIEKKAKCKLKEATQEKIRLESIVQRLQSEKDKTNEEMNNRVEDLNKSVNRLREEKLNLEKQLKIHNDHWHNVVNIDEVVADAVVNINLKVKSKLREAARERAHLESLLEGLMSERDEMNVNNAQLCIK